MDATQSRGFTIVELLIVIVVIGILAAITVTAYGGIKDRAHYRQTQSNLNSINKALRLYHADTGGYPVTGSLTTPGWRYSCSYGSLESFIPGLAVHSQNLSQAPCTDASTNNDTWLYASDGVGYKLLYIRPTYPSSIATSIPQYLRDLRWTSVSGSWGYWTDDWAAK